MQSRMLPGQWRNSWINGISLVYYANLSTGGRTAEPGEQFSGSFTSGGVLMMFLYLIAIVIVGSWIGYKAANEIADNLNW